MTEIEQLKASLKTISDIHAALDEHAIVAITDLQGKITYANDRFCAISQFSRQELLGQDHRLINSGHHSAAFMRELWTTIASGRVWQGEIKNRAKDGSGYWVATTIVPLLNDEGKPREYVSIRTDISLRKQAEEQLRQLNAELEQRIADRTKDLETFSYSASHDLRRPVRAIAGYAEALLEDFGAALPDEGRRQLGVIHSDARKMDALIDDLLTFARVNHRPLNRQTFDPAQVVNAVWAELRSSSPAAGVEMHLGPLPSCTGDSALLKQVWMNLLSNALKYSAKREKPIIDIGCVAIAGVDAFFVRDNGAGFDMGRAKKLFEAFERFHRSEDFAGTGVGLAIVRRIVNRHGGRVWAEAAVDRGATFYFTLAA